MHAFYKQPVILQWVAAGLLLIGGFYPAILIIEAGYNQPLYYGLFLIYLPFGQCCFTPFFTLTGIYTYYSPMLLGYMANKNQIDVHNGGSFDYIFVMRKVRPGKVWKLGIMIFHLEGLLNIIQQIECGSIPATVQISGTSYFFNERTLHKLGFDLEKPSMFYRMNFLVNFIDLTWMYSLSQGKFSMPNVWAAKRAVTPGGRLVENKTTISALLNKLYSNAEQTK